MKISKLTWMVTARTRLSLSIPEALKGRVTITDVPEGFEVRVDGKGVTQVFLHGGQVVVDGCLTFRIGSGRRGEQIEDLKLALCHRVFRALGLRQGWCGHWGYPDGTRIDGRGQVLRAPIEEYMDIMEAMDQEPAK